MFKKISSTANPAIKRLLQLQEKSRARKKEGVFVVEGQREIEMALKGGYEIPEVFIVEDLISEEKLERIFRRRKMPQITALTAEVYEKIAYRGSTEGIIAIIKTRDTGLKQLELPQKNLLILVAEAPEKPGNIGALLRTADAAGVDVVLIANPRTDIFNPNIIRSSVGCVFTNRIATGTTGEIIEFLQRNKIEIYAAALQASKNYSEIDYTGSCAIIVGTEATGLSREWVENSSQNIIIPMQGHIDSMNVSVAAGILIFEAKRQRGFQ
ncbi:RNA methyltransferase [Antarcticibacterium flavum]|uniref:RNA methyltransferase n=1 Tax=Antarcticibacterium flavum TaxID=2058175 RepID=A0A5B7X6F0_9FLAO|nr:MULTISPECIES: RNA methyltransferase [Antarcticibacterium]MCM4159335.1 rRNA methyltransferase [Antarcticibacterium sp. W02-3]QCY70959.1 RNA methyltransferase [Antarcticibacterium flavum]